MLNSDQPSIPAAKPKSSFLPALTALFLLSYGLLTMLVVEQGRTIDAQRYLINQLFSDSTELTALKGKVFRKQYDEAQAKAKAEAQAQGHAKLPPPPSAHVQEPSAQTAVPRVTQPERTQQERARSGQDASKLRKQGRADKPPKMSADSSDERRATAVI